MTDPLAVLGQKVPTPAEMDHLIDTLVPDHAVDNAARPWDPTDDAGHEHRVTPEGD